MQIDVQNIKFQRGHGDSECYTATVYVDGQKAFQASNDGWGGPDQFLPLNGYKGPSALEINDWIKANTPQIEVFGRKIDNSLDIVVGDFLAAKHKEADAKKAQRSFDNLLKKKILGFKGGKLVSWKADPSAANLQKVKALDGVEAVVQLGDAALKERAFKAWSGEAA